MQRRKLQELTIKDNFMFGAVMAEAENCKGLLELVMGIPIDHVVVSKEKSMVYHPEYKGVRLDVYAQSDKNVHYNVEMQVVQKPMLGKRSRYYQSQLDMELLLRGNDYPALPDTVVIFICDFDPFGAKKYRYTFRMRCEESQETNLQDGRCAIFLSTRGINEGEVSKELVSFLKFVKADLEESQKDFQDDYVKKLQRFIGKVKESREMEERFMILEEMLKEEHAEGKMEGRMEGRIEGRKEGQIEGRTDESRELLLTFLEELGEVPQQLRVKIQEEKDLNVLRSWVKTAMKAGSVERFMEKME